MIIDITTTFLIYHNPLQLRYKCILIISLPSLRLIIRSIQISILPKVSLLPHRLIHIDLNRKVSINIHLNSRSIHLIQIPENLLSGLVQVGLTILILHIANWHVDLVLRGKVDTVLVLWYFVWNVHSANN